MEPRFNEPLYNEVLSITNPSPLYKDLCRRVAILCRTRQEAKDKLTFAWFNSTCYHPPPGHTPGDLQIFSHLAVYSPPPGTQKETIPHPRDSSSATNTLFCVQNIDYDIDFRTIAKPDVLTRT